MYAPYRALMCRLIEIPRLFECNLTSHIYFILNSQIVEMIIDNFDEGEHPIHAHGRRVYVMARGKENNGPYNSTQILNTVDPVMRDTVTVAAKSYIGRSNNQQCNAAQRSNTALSLSTVYIHSELTLSIVIFLSKQS
jgi:Multicopper oxidase